MRRTTLILGKNRKQILKVPFYSLLQPGRKAKRNIAPVLPAGGHKFAANSASKKSLALGTGGFVSLQKDLSS